MALAMTDAIARLQPRPLRRVLAPHQRARLRHQLRVGRRVALLDREPSLLPRVLGHARRSLLEHLQQLDQQPIDPFTLEKHQ